MSSILSTSRQGAAEPLTAMPITTAALLVAALACEGRDPAPAPDRVPTAAVMDISEPGGPHMTIYEDTIQACPTCDIRIRPIGSFGSIEDSLLLRSDPIVVEHDSRGRYYATVTLARDHELIVYQRDGAVLRTVGGHGSGPGEFSVISDLFMGENDSLYVAHDLHRISVFDSAGTVARTVIMDRAGNELVTRFVDAGAEGFLLNTEFATPELAGIPLHAYSPEGEHMRAFGSVHLLAEWMQERGDKVPVSRVAASDDDGGVWLVVGGGGYRIERLTADGDVQRVIGVRTPTSWYSPHLSMTSEEALANLERSLPPLPRSSHALPRRREGEPQRTELRPRVPPRGRQRDVRVLPGGLLLVVSHVAAADWQQARVSIDTTRYWAEPVADPGYLWQLHDTVIDIIDVNSGELMARERVSGTGYLTSDGTLYRPTTDATGVIRVQAFAIEYVSTGADQ